MKQTSAKSAILGAAFLMATSAVGPGFLTQTTVFTERLAASFGFVILLSVLLDIAAQLNIWRVIAVSERRAPDLANATLPGSGYVLSILILVGGLAFNIGNVAGAGLGLNVLFGISVETGAIISALLAIAIFLFKEAGRIMDAFTKMLGATMILLIIYVAAVSHPPLGEALARTVFPLKIDALATITLVGGTVGGYISFAGAHRLLDAKISGVAALPQVNRSAATGILLTSVIRFLLFLAALGVVTGGAQIDAANPPASVFQLSAGIVGYKIFGVVMWCAAITSVVGSAYTSVSFVRSFNRFLDANNKWVICVFITISTAVFLFVGQPIKILVIVGTLNGFILPVALALILLAARRADLMKNYKHPLWLQIAGWSVVALIAAMGIYSLQQ